MQIGEKHNRLTAIRPATVEEIEYRGYWMFACDCGKKVIAKAWTVSSGKQKSCGCYHREESSQRAKCQFTKHGLGGTRLYRIWKSMKTRCYNPESKSYKDYGGRGIGICDLWVSNFSAFYDWALSHGYTDELTIDRIDNEKGYSPENCRWLSQAGQALNKRTSKHYEFNGRFWNIKELSDFYGIKESTLRDRLASGWTIERAVYEPVRSAS